MKIDETWSLAGASGWSAKNDDAHTRFNQPSGQQQLIVTERRVVITREYLV